MYVILGVYTMIELKNVSSIAVYTMIELKNVSSIRGLYYD